MRIYGGFLAITHIITWFFWFNSTSIKNILMDPLPLCWPFMSECQYYRNWPEYLWKIVAVFYISFAVATMLIFFFTNKVKLAYILFLLLTLLKFFLLLMDYRLMGNYHYMPFLISLVYLFVPQKKESILYSIVIFYISAGLLKLDTEWLSGSALLRNFFVEGEILEWLLAYTIIFEVLVVLLSLSSSIYLFLFSFPQIVGFHAMSWHIVGYFYPCVMFSLLIAFPLFRFQSLNGKWVFTNLENLKRIPAAFIVLLFLVQIVPRILSPNLAVDSQGRLFTLNMLDARVQCDHFSYIKADDNSYVETSSDRNDLGTRISCDPLVYTSEAKALCKQPGVEEVPSFLVAKKSTHNNWTMVLNIPNYCDKEKAISWWGGLE